MNANRKKSSRISFLAYLHRYCYPLLAVLIPLLIGKKFGSQYMLLSMGTAFLLLALYDLIGYKRKWRHICCAYQNARHKQMPPDAVNWDSLKKSDVYGAVLVDAIFGAGLLAVFLLL